MLIFNHAESISDQITSYSHFAYYLCPIMFIEQLKELSDRVDALRRHL